jgi:YHS domain-containing protein
MFMKFVGELIEFILIVWVVRFVLHNLLGTGNRHTPPFQPNSNAAPNSAPVEKVGEMKKDPQCGTYVSTELSIKVRHQGEVLHFCSPQCQQAFLEARSGKPA